MVTSILTIRELSGLNRRFLALVRQQSATDIATARRTFGVSTPMARLAAQWTDETIDDLSACHALLFMPVVPAALCCDSPEVPPAPDDLLHDLSCLYLLAARDAILRMPHTASLLLHTPPLLADLLRSWSLNSFHRACHSGLLTFRPVFNEHLVPQLQRARHGGLRGLLVWSTPPVPNPAPVVRLASPRVDSIPPGGDEFADGLRLLTQLCDVELRPPAIRSLLPSSITSTMVVATFRKRTGRNPPQGEMPVAVEPCVSSIQRRINTTAIALAHEGLSALPDAERFLATYALYRAMLGDEAEFDATRVWFVARMANSGQLVLSRCPECHSRIVHPRSEGASTSYCVCCELVALDSQFADATPRQRAIPTC